MSRLLLTHLVGAGDLEPEVAHMTLAANAWVVDYLGNCQWEIEAPDVHSLRFCLLPGWVIYEAVEADEDIEPIAGMPAATTSGAAPAAIGEDDEGSAPVDLALPDIDASTQIYMF